MLYYITLCRGCYEFFKPFKSSRCIKESFCIPENRLHFPTTKGFSMKISMTLICQYMVIFFNFSLTSNHLHPLQVENCDSNSRLVVDEDDNGKFRIERVNWPVNYEFGSFFKPTFRTQNSFYLTSYKSNNGGII